MDGGSSFFLLKTRYKRFIHYLVAIMQHDNIEHQSNNNTKNERKQGKNEGFYRLSECCRLKEKAKLSINKLRILHLWKADNPLQYY